jgi:hypothetical protein
LPRSGTTRESEFWKSKFVHGRTYQYFDVDLSTFKKLESALSKGTFFNENIKDEYACARIA